MKTKPHIFKTFPEFSKLTLADREGFQSLIVSYPSLSDISFGSLMTFWSWLDNVAVSQLGACLVISYVLAGDEKMTGLCVVGDKEVDEAICMVFDWQKSKGEKPRLVHVPEFTVSSMRFPDLYTFENEREHDECVVPVSKLCSLDQLIRHKRWKIRRFLTEIDQERVTMKSLDLSISDNRHLLLEAAERWRGQGVFNSTGAFDDEALVTAIIHAEKLGFENVCMYLDGELHVFMLYQLPEDSEYVIINFARLSYSLPHLFEFAVYKYAQWFDDMGVTYANIDSDFGLPMVRSTKLALGPENFFRKYTIQPAS